MNRRLLAFAGIASALLWATAANAVTISVGLQQSGVNGGAITNEGSSATGVFTFSGAYGTFVSNTVSGTGSPPLTTPALLDGNSIDVSSATPGTLKVYITSQGNTSPTGLVGFLSTFTSNALTAGWTVMEQTFLDAGNGVFALTTPLSSAMFAAIGTSVAGAVANTGGAYSLTEVYTIVSNGLGNANSTINISSVPLPGALPLFATGLLGLWALRRKRKDKSAESLNAVSA